MITKLAWSFLFLSNLLMGIIFVWLVFPYQAVIVDDISTYKPGFFDKFYKIIIVQQPFKVVSDEYVDYLPVVYKGQPIPIEIEYIKYLDVETSYDRYVVCQNGNLQPLSEYHNVYQPIGNFTGEKKVLTRSNILPKETDGTYCRLVFPTQYIINKLNTINTKVESELFYVATSSAQETK